MAIAVTCGTCGVRSRFKAQHAGKTTKCRACNAAVVVEGETIPDHDVFLSYSSKDKNVADAICTGMESRRVRCWIAPRDILPGKAWAGAILDAIDDVPLMVLIYSANSNNSPQVLREIDRAISRNVIVIPFRIENCQMTKEMEYYIAAAHWLDAIDGPIEQHIATLVETARRFLSPDAPTSHTRQQPNEARRPRQTWLPLLNTCLLIVAIASIAFVGLRMGRSQPDRPVVTPPVPVLSSISSTRPIIKEPAVTASSPLDALPSVPTMRAGAWTESLTVGSVWLPGERSQNPGSSMTIEAFDGVNLALNQRAGNGAISRWTVKVDEHGRFQVTDIEPVKIPKNAPALTDIHISGLVTADTLTFTGSRRRGNAIAPYDETFKRQP